MTPDADEASPESQEQRKKKLSPIGRLIKPTLLSTLNVDYDAAAAGTGADAGNENIDRFDITTARG